MKKTFISALAALIAFSAMAVPAKPGIRTIKQPDGTEISVMLHGDERFHTFTTTDMLPVARGESGCFEYITQQGISGIVAHNPGERTAAEADFIKAHINSLSVAALAENSPRVQASRQAKSASRSADPAKAPARIAQVPGTGSPRIPVLLVAYKDKGFRDGAKAIDTFTDFFEKGTNSARQYFVDQSNGKFTPQIDVYGPVTLSKNRVNYGGNRNGNDKGVGAMVAEAVIALKSKIDYSLYDNNGDGACDVMIVLYAGDGEASSYEDDAADAVWPCQWALSSSDYGKSLKYNGVTIDRFAVFNELYGADLSKIDGIGTFCHEFSHCLDLPDFYDTNYGPHFGMSYWSLLDTGCYNNDGYTPIGYSAYEKDFMGWLNIPEATENTRYTLPIFNQKNAATDVAYKITNPADKNEYYILENRYKQGWDKYIPASGMMITHVTYDEDAWLGNYVNDYDLQRMTIIPADNNLKIDSYGTGYRANEADLKGDLWPYGNSNELTDTSKPAATLYSGSSKLMGKPITEITRNTDNTISLWFMKAPNPPVSAPALTEPTDIKHDRFTATWEHPDAPADATLSYTLKIMPVAGDNQDEPTLFLSSNFATSEDGWTKNSSGYAENENNALRLGSSSRSGSITSPAIFTDNRGVVSVVVKAQAYVSDPSTLVVTLLNASGTAVESKTVTLTTDIADYCITFTSAPQNSTVKVRLANTGSRRRIYLYSTDIYNGDASGKTESEAAAIFINGINGFSHEVSNLDAGATYTYCVKAVPSDDDAYTESSWSAPRTVMLLTSGIENVEPIGNTDAAPVEYYTLTGRRISPQALTPGIYLRRQGSNTSKITIR